MDIQKFSGASGNFGGESPGIYTEIVPQSKGMPQFVGSKVNTTYAIDECYSTSGPTNIIATVYDNEIDISGRIKLFT